MSSCVPLITKGYLLYSFDKCTLSQTLTIEYLKNMLSTSKYYTIQYFIELGLFTNNDITTLFSTSKDIQLLRTPNYGSQSISQLLMLGYSKDDLYKAGFPIWIPHGNQITSPNKTGHCVAINNYGNIIAITEVLHKFTNKEQTRHIFNCTNDIWTTTKIIDHLTVKKKEQQVRIFNCINDEWIEIGNFTEDWDSDETNYSMSLSNNGTIFAISNPFYRGKRGRVYIYEYGMCDNSLGWELRGLPIDGENEYDQSGHSISLNNNGNIIAIGSPFHQNGTTCVYEYKDLEWKLKGNIISGYYSKDFSGGLVSLSHDGNTIAIGPHKTIENSGNVYIYEYNDDFDSWIQKGGTIQDKSANIFSGNSLSLNGNGNMIAIGTTYNMNKGHVRVYMYDELKTEEVTCHKSSDFGPIGWSRLGNDIEGDPGNNYTGYSISLRNNPMNAIVAIGEFGYNSNCDIGNIKTYKLQTDIFSNKKWERLGFHIDGIISDNNSGSSISLNDDGTMIIIGSLSNKGNEMDTLGKISVFTYQPIYPQLPIILNDYGECIHTQTLLSNDEEPDIKNIPETINETTHETNNGTNSEINNETTHEIINDTTHEINHDTNSETNTETIHENISVTINDTNSDANTKSEFNYETISNSKPYNETNISNEKYHHIRSVTDLMIQSKSFNLFLTSIGINNIGGIYSDDINSIQNDPYKAYQIIIHIPNEKYENLIYFQRSTLMDYIKTNYANQLTINKSSIGIILKSGSIRIEVNILNDNVFITELPNVPICFPAETPVSVDQGDIQINKIIPGLHTIRGKRIIAISETSPIQKHIICFEKDCMGKNIPSQETICSKDHRIMYKGAMKTANQISILCKNVTKIPYYGEPLYNVLLENHGYMHINNMICETLHPKNIMAKISTIKNINQKALLVKKLNESIKKKVYKSC